MCRVGHNYQVGAPDAHPLIFPDVMNKVCARPFALFAEGWKHERSRNSVCADGKLLRQQHCTRFCKRNARM